MVRPLALIGLAALVLSGCSTAGTVADTALLGGNIHALRSRQAEDVRYKADTDKCVGQRDFTACLQHAIALHQAIEARLPRPTIGWGAASDGQTAYSASECIGAIVNSQCQGSILPNAAVHQTCHGQVLNGQCTGPMF